MCTDVLMAIARVKEPSNLGTWAPLKALPARFSSLSLFKGRHKAKVKTEQLAKVQQSLPSQGFTLSGSAIPGSSYSGTSEMARMVKALATKLDNPRFDPHLESTSWKERTDSDKLSYDLYT